MLQSLTQLYQLDIDRAIKELELYQDEVNLWKKVNQVNNPAGNLGLHLAGNLQHFIGHQLGGSDYQRNRTFEFNATDVPRAEIIAELEKAKQAVTDTLSQFPAERLSETLTFLQQEVTLEYFILFLHGHLMYHTGQISYHRRTLEASAD